MYWPRIIPVRIAMRIIFEIPVFRVFGGFQLVFKTRRRALG
jgi:hypothetical protein